MTNDNKFKPTNQHFKELKSIPKTETRIILNDWSQPVKKSPLSVAARSKVVNRSGSNYLSESQEYGPCSYSDCRWPASVPCRLDINIEGINRKWARRTGNGDWLPGHWEAGNFNSNQLSRWSLIINDVDQSRRVLPLLSNDSVYTINFWGTHCAEDARFCNVSMDIIRKTIDSHEKGNGIDESIRLDSDISKWTRWTVKTVAIAAATAVNPVGTAVIGGTVWGAGKAMEHHPDANDYDKGIFRSISNFGGDVFWGGATSGIVGKFSGNLDSYMGGIGKSKIINTVKDTSSSAAEAMARHEYHRANGRNYDSDCPICNA